MAMLPLILPCPPQMRPFLTADPKEALVHGVTADLYIYCKVRSTFVSSKLAKSFALTPDVKSFIEDNWREVPMKTSYKFSPKFGHLHEPLACSLYAKKTGRTVRTCRNVVNPKIPFLITAPDGLVFTDKGFETAIEIKTITDVKSKDDYRLIRCCEHRNGGWVLRTRTETYAQIQFTMLSLALESMDLVLYFPCMKDILVVKVKRDTFYQNSLIQRVYDRYVKHLVPHLISKLNDKSK